MIECCYTLSALDLASSYPLALFMAEEYYEALAAVQTAVFWAEELLEDPSDRETVKWQMEALVASWWRCIHTSAYSVFIQPRRLSHLPFKDKVVPVSRRVS